MEIKRLKVNDFENAIWAMREPMNSFDKIDSKYCWSEEENICSECFYHNSQNLFGCDSTTSENHYVIGKHDMKLMKSLYKAGPEHSKFMRQIPISFELVNAPVYWLAEFDTYKVGVTRNSSSFMHKGLSKPFTYDNFEVENYDCTDFYYLNVVIERLNTLRDEYLATKGSDIFLKIRKILPMSYLYNSMISTNYGVISHMINQRKNHRLPEWRYFCNYMLENAPYLAEIMGVKDETDKA